MYVFEKLWASHMVGRPRLWRGIRLFAYYTPIRQLTRRLTLTASSFLSPTADLPKSLTASSASLSFIPA